MVKTPDEVAALRRCAAVADVGQVAAREGARAGRSELEVFAEGRRLAMEAAAGGRVCVTGELSAGRERAAALFDWPRNHLLAAGDPVVVDLAPRVAGYWGDSCNTLVVGGEPDAAQAAVLRAAHAGLETALATPPASASPPPR